MMLWLKRMFRKRGQRFCNGETVRHRHLGHTAEIVQVICIGGQCEYRVLIRCRPKSILGSGSTITDYWSDSEIADA